MDTKESYAVVTGASQGLGKAFAESLAKKKINVILISLPDQHLKEVSEEIAESFNVKTHYYEVDLSVNENVLKLTDWLNKSFKIHILINNAGIGGTIKFLDASPNYINNILQASYCIDQLFKKDSVIMVNPVSWLVMKILPIWIKLPLMTNAIRKEIEA